MGGGGTRVDGENGLIKWRSLESGFVSGASQLEALLHAPSTWGKQVGGSVHLFSCVCSGEPAPGSLLGARGLLFTSQEAVISQMKSDY